MHCFISVPNRVSVRTIWGSLGYTFDDNARILHPHRSPNHSRPPKPLAFLTSHELLNNLIKHPRKLHTSLLRSVFPIKGEWRHEHSSHFNPSYTIVEERQEQLSNESAEYRLVIKNRT